MSEQDTDLETAIHQFQQVETFNQFEESWLDVLQKSTKVKDPNEARERVKKIAEDKKTELMKNNPQFKSIMDQRKREQKRKADENRALHKAQMSEATTKANRIRSETKAKINSAKIDAERRSSGVDEWVAKTRIKIKTPEEAQHVLDDKLGCPNPTCKGYGENRHNILNDFPTCMRCYHRLVPKSKFKDYNRAYWRRFNKKKRKKK